MEKLRGGGKGGEKRGEKLAVLTPHLHVMQLALTFTVGRVVGTNNGFYVSC